MSRIFLPHVTKDAFGTIPRLIVVGFLLTACAGCSYLKIVPAKDLQAARQRQQALEVRQQHLLQELRKQIAVSDKLNAQLAAANSKLRNLRAKQNELHNKLKAESVAHAELLETIDTQNLQIKSLDRKHKQQSAEIEALYGEVAELERQLSNEDMKREEWEQWQLQLERDLVRQSADSIAGDDASVADSKEEPTGDESSGEEWSFWLEEPDSNEQPTKRETLDYSDANLYLLLLEKKAYIARLGEEIEKGILEVVRANAKLRSLESKAEAASNLAEAEIAVESLRASGDSWKSDPSVIKAEQLTRLGAQEFKEGNYGGALYLTGQVKSLIDAARARSLDQKKSSVVEGEVPFLLPLTLQLLGQSNVRKGPGSNFDVMSVWESGTAIVGHGFKGQWVHVTNEAGVDGWVFYKSVGSI